MLLSFLSGFAVIHLTALGTSPSSSCLAGKTLLMFLTAVICSSSSSVLTADWAMFLLRALWDADVEEMD